MKSLSVLLVENDEPSRQRLAQLLRSTRHRVICVAGPETALRSLAQRHFDVVVTGMALGGADELEFIQAVTRIAPHLRIVAMSEGETDLGDSRFDLAVAFGACLPLVKPFTLAELVAAIEGAEAFA